MVQYNLQRISKKGFTKNQHQIFCCSLECIYLYIFFFSERKLFTVILFFSFFDNFSIFQDFKTYPFNTLRELILARTNSVEFRIQQNQLKFHQNLDKIPNKMKYLVMKFCIIGYTKLESFFYLTQTSFPPDRGFDSTTTHYISP